MRFVFAFIVALLLALCASLANELLYGVTHG